MPGFILRLVLALILSAAAGGTAWCHEVRPALLRISELPNGRYDILWKQPAMGEIAVHLVPHISGGLLEGAASTVQAAPDYETHVWSNVDAGPSGLEGRLVAIEGLDQTITDAVVSVTLPNGESVQEVLHPRDSARILHLGQRGLASADFLVLGLRHIVMGPDHLLFLLGLLLIVSERSMLIKTVTAFTIAHSLTLALATFGAIHFSTALINALIALSILYVAPEAIRAYAGGSSLTIRYPWIVAFAFGLLHGMGFASGLTSFGLSTHALVSALVLFNVGVELGQLAFIALVFALRRSSRLMQFDWPRPVQLLPAYLIGTLGMFWTVAYGARALGVS